MGVRVSKWTKTQVHCAALVSDLPVGVEHQRIGLVVVDVHGREEGLVEQRGEPICTKKVAVTGAAVTGAAVGAVVTGAAVVPASKGAAVAGTSPGVGCKEETSDDIVI